MDKDDVVYIYNGILLSHIKEWNFAICSNTDGLGGYYGKWNKSNRERQILYNNTYIWNLRNTTNELIYKTEIVTDVKNKITVNRRKRGGGMNCEPGIDIYTLICIK